MTHVGCSGLPGALSSGMCPATRAPSLMTGASLPCGAPLGVWGMLREEPGQDSGCLSVRPPPCQDIQQLLQLQQLVLVPGHHLQPPAQFLLPQAQQSQPGKTPYPGRPPPTPPYASRFPPSPRVVPLVSPGLLPTPNLFQLPQQTQGALLTSQPRAGLPTQVSSLLSTSGCG